MPVSSLILEIGAWNSLFIAYVVGRNATCCNLISQDRLYFSGYGE